MLLPTVSLQVLLSLSSKATKTHLWRCFSYPSVSSFLVVTTHAPSRSDGVNMISSAVHSVHRSVLQRILTKHIGDDDRIHCSKRLTSYSDSSPGAGSEITLHFKDGTTATCDLVIGSDGIRSTVRQTMFDNLAQDAEGRGQTDEAARLRGMIEPVYSGHIAYRGLAPASALSETAFQNTRTLQLVSIFHRLCR